MVIRGRPEKKEEEGGGPFNSYSMTNLTEKLETDHFAFR